MKKTLPPSTLDELSVPNRKFRYFDAQGANIFRSEAEGFELVNAWWLAEASLLAYGDAGLIDAAFDAAGLSAAGYAARFFEAGGTQCFVMHDEAAIIVAFRGTQLDDFWAKVIDISTDVHFIPVPDGAGGLVHQGFLEGLSFVWEPLRAHLGELLNGERRLWLTGHSLGAALATLAAERLNRETAAVVQGLYTYGSPRVGDSNFKSRFAHKNLAARTFRIVNNSDLIARVPPRILYTHIGTLKFIDNAGHLHHIDDESQILSDTNALQSVQPFLHRLRFLGHALSGFKLLVPGFLADHAPVYYALHAWNNYDQ
ncbi:MAG: lipase family protein [Acidobacteria bacterium]|nr:lipase family protein [Acidobacteriota bacterium]